MRYLAPLLLVAALAACGSEPDQPAANEAAPAAQVQAGGVVPLEQQKASEPGQRLALCQEDLKRWTEGGMIVLDPTGKPAVTRERWDGMSPVGRTEVTEILACIQSGGGAGAQQVAILDAASGQEIARVGTPNTLHMP